MLRSEFLGTELLRTISAEKGIRTGSAWDTDLELALTPPDEADPAVSYLVVVLAFRCGHENKALAEFKTRSAFRLHRFAQFPDPTVMKELVQQAHVFSHAQFRAWCPKFSCPDPLPCSELPDILVDKALAALKIPGGNQ